MVGGSKKVAVINNAIDHKSDIDRKVRADKEMNDMRSLGFEPTEIDLRQYFKNLFPDNGLDDYGVVWVRGGNVFVLMLAFKKSGFDRVILSALENDKLVYAGYSAGGCILSPSLKYFDTVDDPSLTTSTYGEPADYRALGILDLYFEPHYQSDHPESSDIDQEIAKLESDGAAYRALRDGEVLVIDGKKQEILR